jgi:RNA-directed DNA polymerase
LKEIQSRILARMLEQIELPGYVNGGVKGRSLSHNIELHAGAAALVTVDIKSFFPSITPKQVYSIWRYRLNCCPRFAAILTRLTTFEGRLPQGAPTSTYLANLLIASIDGEIVRACHKYGITYSTWVDDLAFSGADARLMIQIVIDVLMRNGFSVSHKKLRVMGPSNRSILNGVIAGLKLNVPREFRSAIRSGTYKLRMGLVTRNEFDSYVKSMHGTIDHVARFNRRLADRLRDDFNHEVASASKRLGFTSPSNQMATRSRSARA